MTFGQIHFTTTLHQKVGFAFSWGIFILFKHKNIFEGGDDDEDDDDDVDGLDDIEEEDEDEEGFDEDDEEGEGEEVIFANTLKAFLYSQVTITANNIIMKV